MSVFRIALRSISQTGLRVFPAVLFGFALTMALTACDPLENTPGSPSDSSSSDTSSTADGPVETCWAKYVSPAVIETVTSQSLVKPAELASDGTVKTPAVHETETVQKIVQERKETQFQILCDDDLTPELVKNVQRALLARDLYDGPITGRIDTRTETAIALYQEPMGIKSGLLSLEAARKLGLVAIETD